MLWKKTNKSELLLPPVTQFCWCSRLFLPLGTLRSCSSPRLRPMHIL